MHNIIVLGSGRSGTSMITGILEKAGCFTGEKSDYLKSNKSNPKGFFEDKDVNTINEDILKETLITIPETIRKLFFPSFTFYRARWLAKLPLNKIIKSTEGINRRIKNILKKEPFCYKDPRFSYTLPIWLKFLDSNTKYIVVYREPSKTINSILRECKENPGLQALKMDKSLASKIWVSMYSHILKNYKQSSHKENWIFFHFDQIFNQKKVEQMESFFNLKLDVNFAEKKLSRSVEDEIYVNKKTESIYNQLLKLS